MDSICSFCSVLWSRFGLVDNEFYILPNVFRIDVCSFFHPAASALSFSHFCFPKVAMAMGMAMEMLKFCL